MGTVKEERRAHRRKKRKRKTETEMGGLTEERFAGSGRGIEDGIEG